MENDIIVKTQNSNLEQQSSFLNKILDISRRNNNSNFLQTVSHHLNVYQKYMKLAKEKGQAAFPKRLEYQKFQVAKLFIDRLDLLEFSADSSLKGFKNYIDTRSPPIDAFNMTPDKKESKKIQFCHNIDRGDILHLRVVEESETEYKMLVINKYNENERVVDYLIYAYLVKSYQLNSLPRPLDIGDFVRAAVLGKLKMEENVFSKLLVTLNKNLVHEKYKDVMLGLVFKSDIPFYPEDISEYSSFLDYMKAKNIPDDSQEMINCMASLGIDPYKIYSFHEAGDGKKLGMPKEIDYRILEKEAIEKSMNLVKKAEKQLLDGADYKSVFSILEEALKIYSMNDAALAVRGQLYKQLFISGQFSDSLSHALEDLEESLDMNTCNMIATREYLTLLLMSEHIFAEKGDEAKIEEIKKVIAQNKDICDVTRIILPDTLKEDGM